MKIAIHQSEGSFSENWIEYCMKNDISYKVVNAHDSDIINQVRDCDVFMWHHHHARYKDVLAAKPILFALVQAGFKVFPDINTGWHFDNKVAQKYLLEAVNAPLVPSDVFYDKNDAINWLRVTEFPVVFKLKGGAGARNVILVKNYNQGLRLIKRAFSKGFTQYSPINYFKDKFLSFKKTKNPKDLLQGLYRLLVPTKFARMIGREKGYVYFQRFVPNNAGDIRLIVIGKKYAYGMKRMNREGDFRASGSNNFVYDNLPISVVETGFHIAKNLDLQSVAFDFIFDHNKRPLIIEMSYAFGTKGSSRCPGYWTDDFKWHEEEVDPMKWIIEECIK